MMVSSKSAKSSKISIIWTPAVLTIVNESIVNVFNGKIILFSFKFSLSMKNNSGFQKLLKNAKIWMHCHTWSDFFAANLIVTLWLCIIYKWFTRIISLVHMQAALGDLMIDLMKMSRNPRIERFKKDWNYGDS
jgi:hypothetical protein